MKIAVTGKGGVGKTTLAAFLAHVFSREGMNVLAIDADPDSNLAGALGFPDADSIVPVADMKSLIQERTGTQNTSIKSFFKMNPHVEDLPEALAREHDGVRLLVMGTVKSGGSGCVCAESVLLKTLVQHLLLRENETVIMDMEAGIEHLGRATAFAVDLMLIVIEPGARSVETAAKIQALAGDIGIKKIAVAACKIRDDEELRFVKKALKDMPFVGHLPYSTEIMEADMKGIPPFSSAASLIPAVKEIAENIRRLARDS